MSRPKSAKSVPAAAPPATAAAAGVARRARSATGATGADRTGVRARVAKAAQAAADKPSLSAVMARAGKAAAMAPDGASVSASKRAKAAPAPGGKAKRASLGVGAPALEPVSPAPAPLKVDLPLVRDGFTMPGADFALIAQLKARALAGRREVKKSELLRAGLHALVQLDDAAFLAVLAGLAPVKVGRRKKGH